MKAIELRKYTIRNFSIGAFIALILGGGLFYNNYAKKSFRENVQKINSDTSSLENKTNELIGKQKEITKYVNIWRKLPDNKKDLQGIDMDEVNNLFSVLAKKHLITNVDIKVNLPQKVNGGIFNTKKIDVYYTRAILTYNSLNDVNAIKFAKDFLNLIKGYNVVASINISKGNALSSQDLISISKGKFPKLLSVKVDFHWYSFKNQQLNLRNKDNDNKKRLINL